MAAASQRDVERSALVLYASETGNAQDVAEEVGRIAERLRFDTHVSDLNSIRLASLLQYDVVLFSISTTGQGDLPANAQAFWKALRSVRLRPGSLSKLRFTSFGLGDTSYPKFNWAHRKLYNRLVQLGARPICDRGESDEQHPEGIDGTLLPWTEKLRECLLQQYPLPEGMQPIPDDVMLQPRWTLELVDESDAQAISASNTDGGHDTNSPQNNEDGNSLHVETPPESLLPIPNSITASVISNDRITPALHWQDVRHLTLSTSESASYAPGDVLTVYPKNFPSETNAFLDLQSWTSIADRPLKFVSTNLSSSSHSPPPVGILPPNYNLTLRTLLTNHLDILSIPRRSFFAHLIHFTTDPFQRDRLLEFINPEYIDELYDYTTRPRRSILEVLQEFETVHIPWRWIASIIPVMRGRQFSIASGGALKRQPSSSISSANGPNFTANANLPDPDTGTRIELLIAIVKYRTVIKRIRQGVCTRYIASLRPGQSLAVTLTRGGLNVNSETDAGRPFVMIGPGTGVAPMRSLIHERLTWEADRQASGNGLSGDLLFFGCRNEHADYFFREEWERLQEEQGLDVFTAFSRDQRQKVYVQDLVRLQAKKVCQALEEQNGVVYICGSSGKMPQAVREALIEIFQKEASLSRENAETRLVTMEKQGRYKQETW